MLDREPADVAGTGVTRPADEGDTERQVDPEAAAKLGMSAAASGSDAPAGAGEGDAPKKAGAGDAAEPSAAEGAAEEVAEPSAAEGAAEPSGAKDDAAEPSSTEAEPVGAVAATPAAAPTRAGARASGRRPASRQGPVFEAGGFWRRSAAAAIDLAVIVPSSLILAWIAGAIAGLELPPSRHRGLDFWVDLLLASDPAFLGALGLTLAIGLLYALVFQLTTGRTLGMRALKLRIIDLYGDQPSTSRVLVRTAGYLAGLATLGLGFLWAGFDSEKRALHDWLSGTYVVNE